MDRLPRELLLLVGKQIELFPRYHKTLNTLTIFCRRFYDVFQCLLYRCIPCDPFTPAFLRLIIRLWKQPKLASQVRHLYVHWSRYDKPRFDGFDNNEVADFIEGALKEIFTSEEKETQSLWRKRLTGVDTPIETQTRARNEPRPDARTEAWLGLLLIRVNNLRKLEFRFETSDLIHTILHKAAKREQPFHKDPPFPHLKEVRGHVEWGQPPIGSGFLNPFFYFPAVRKVYGFGIAEDDDEDCSPLDICLLSCPVREITIDECFYCVGMLSWLAICTRLERLAIRISLEPEYYHINSGNIFRASQYRLALLRFAPSLKTLHICFDDRYKCALEDIGGVDLPFGTFTDFAVLEDLTVRHAHLTGALSPHSGNPWGTKRLNEILSSSLRRLEIKDLVEDHELQLLLELWELVHRGICYNLEQLVLHFYPDDDDVMIDALSRLEVECEARGVCFETVTESVDGDPGRSLELD